MQEIDPFISIVVPSYNRADLIAKTLHSLLDQTYNNYEIIVVDDGSTDNTEEVVAQVKSERVSYYKKQNAERAAARNYGARKAKGDYVNFFDSDDLALQNHVASAAEMIKKYQQPEWFHLGFAWATPEIEIFRKVDQYRGDTLNKLIAKGNPLSCNGVFLRRDIILQHRFNEDRSLSASEDYELWVRLAARYPLYFTNTITSLVIDHEMRSVRTIHGEKLINRLNLLLHYLEQDQKVLSYFGKKFRQIIADSYSYIALHLAEDPAFKAKSVKYLITAVRADAGTVTNRRFYAILKNLLIKWPRS